MIGLQITQLFFGFVLCIGLYALAYKSVFNWTWTESVFSSIRVQTLAGSFVDSEKEYEKILISSQLIIAYLLTSGILIVSTAESVKHK